MSEAELYRAQANALRKQAAAATTDMQKEQLERIARYWEEQAAKAERNRAPSAG